MRSGGLKAVEDQFRGMECTEDDCDREATVRLHIPWDDNRLVCSAHARVLGRPDGVVADPLEDDWEP